jgi:hypothetical protein
MLLDLSHLHHVLLKQIIVDGYAPTVKTLTEIFGRSSDDVIQSLKDLEEYHGAVLHPKISEVWVIHPFALSPTNFWVKSARGQWWGNCAWCSLGIASILKHDVTITTTLGGETDQIRFNIKDGYLESDQPLLIHFPIPMAKAWDNVTFTCSVMQVFTSENEIDDWCKRHNLPKGDVQPIENVWQFAQVWYGNHLREDWKKWTLEEAKSIFQQFNFTHDVWNVATTNSRF